MVYVPGSRSYMASLSVVSMGGMLEFIIIEEFTLYAYDEFTK
jgi:hypothetical protein